jgi:hypothetical protein
VTQANANQLKQLEADEALARSFAAAEAVTALASQKTDAAAAGVRPHRSALGEGGITHGFFWGDRRRASK